MNKNGLNINKEVASLRRMTVTQLRERYGEVHGEPTRSGNKDWLVRRIAWRMQANTEGGLSERARRRAMELAKDAYLRVRLPVQSMPPLRLHLDSPPAVAGRLAVPPDHRLPLPGALLTRHYRGKTIHVRVLPKGFEYEGEVYRSLSAVAEVITGSHWSGYRFFNLTKPAKLGRKEAQP